MAITRFIDVEYILAQANDLNGALREETDKVNEIIDAVMWNDMKDLLGERLFADLANNPSATARGSYPNLLNGSTYEHNGFAYFTHRGVKFLTYLHWMARYRFWGQDTDTAFGHGQLQGDNIVKSSDSRNKEVFGEYDKQAKKCWQDINLFLDRKSSDYTEWVGSEPRTSNSVEHIVIQKLKVR